METRHILWTMLLAVAILLSSCREPKEKRTCDGIDTRDENAYLVEACAMNTPSDMYLLHVNCHVSGKLSPTIACAEVDRGCFSVWLPGNLDEGYLTNVMDSDLFKHAIVSDETASILTDFYFRAYGDDEFPPTLFGCDAEFVYSDKPFKVTGERKEEPLVIYDIQIEKGWNTIESVFYDEDDNFYIKMRNKSGNLSWGFYREPD